MAELPAFERVAYRGDQRLREAAVPVLGSDRQRAEKPEAAPARREIRTDQRPILLDRERLGVFCTVPAVDIVEIGPEGFEVRHPEKRAERDSDNPLRLRQVGLGERSDNGHMAALPVRLY